MNQIFGSGLLAVAAGALVAVIAFVPFVAVSYRRRGGLTLGRALLWAAAAVYFWAIWTYTLVPVPDTAVYRCAGVNLQPLGFVDDIRTAVATSGRYLTDPAVLQVVLNVVLFVPLGFFLRVLGGRGILVAGTVGLVVSGIVETTQLTGVWGIFPCAYRVFDVDDLLTNTVGALLGSLLAFAVPAQHRGVRRAPDADLPRPVTRRRRTLGMVCDVLGYSLASTAVSVAVQAVVVLLLQDETAGRDGAIASTTGTAVALAVWLAVTLVTGRSVGDLATRVRYTDGVLPVWLARPLRFALGIGGYQALTASPDPFPFFGFVLAVVAVILVFVWPDGRGLPGWVGRRRVVDDRSGVVAPAAPR